MSVYSTRPRSVSLSQAIVAASAFLVLALTGCGAGSKVVSTLDFKNEVQNNDLYVSMDATLAPGGIVLPATKLPIYNPNNPSQVLGSLETNGLHVVVSIDATTALKLPGLVDGTKLPGGQGLPLVLPSGLVPVGIPVFNSTSVVYLAISGNQILLGVAVNIAKEDSLKLPISIFLPFTVSAKVSGTAGFYLGEKQGLAIMALADITPTAVLAAASSSSPESMSITSNSVSSLASAKAFSLKASAAPANAAISASGRIDVRNDAISNSSVKRLEKTWKKLRSVRLD